MKSIDQLQGFFSTFINHKARVQCWHPDVKSTCPMHHSDQRYAPALCLAVAQSLQLHGFFSPQAEVLETNTATTSTVLKKWQTLLEIASSEVPESWLQAGQEAAAALGGVEWVGSAVPDAAAAATDARL